MKDDAAFERRTDAARYISLGGARTPMTRWHVSYILSSLSHAAGITTKRYMWYLHLTDAEDSYDSLSCGTWKLFVAPASIFNFLGTC